MEFLNSPNAIQELILEAEESDRIEANTFDIEAVQVSSPLAQGRGALELNNFQQQSQPASPPYLYPPAHQASIQQPLTIEMMSQVNATKRIVREFEKNNDEDSIKNWVAYYQSMLAQKQLPTTPHFSLNANRELSFAVPDEILYLIDGTALSPITALLSALTAVAIACTNKIVIRCDENWVEQTSIMASIFSNSGTRKSNVVAKVRAPFDLYVSSRNQLVIKDNAGLSLVKSFLKNEEQQRIKAKLEQYSSITSKSEKTEFLRKLAAEGVVSTSELIDEYSILLDSCTQSGLLRHLRNNNEQVGVITAEADAINGLLLNSKSDPSLFNKLHNQESYKYISYHKEITLGSPTLSMLNIVQPSIAVKLFSKSNLRETGATARILPYYETIDGINSIGSVGMVQTSGSFFNAKILSILHKYHDYDDGNAKYSATLSPEAYQHVKNFEEEIKRYVNGMDAYTHACLRKLHGYAVRFAWAIHLLFTDSFHETPISYSSMQMAVELCRMLLPHIEFAQRPSGYEAHENALKVLKFLQHIDLQVDTVKYGYIDSRTIQARVHRTAEQVTNALKILKLYGYVAVFNAGGKSNIVAMHPRIKGYEDMPIWC